MIIALTCKQHRIGSYEGVGANTGLWTVDWTVDWTLDWTVDWTGLWTGLDCGLHVAMRARILHKGSRSQYNGFQGRGDYYIF